MRVRLGLIAILILSGCQLSDRQQVGVLKFAATTIAGATTKANTATVTAPSSTATKPCAKRCAKTSFRHIQSRILYARSRMQRVVTRVMHFEMFAAERTCPRAKQSPVRS
jgi:hypothetical protein